MAYERRSFEGGAISTTLASGISAAATSITIADTTGWPDGSNGDFYIVINPDGAAEEKVRIASRTGTSLSVATSGRGADGTSAQTHSSGAAVKHVFVAVDADEANYTAVETVGKVTTIGDLLVADGANSLTRLAKGSDSTFLGVSDAGAVGYRKVAAADFTADMATQAELNTHAADTTSVHGITDTSALALTADVVADGDAAGGVLSGTYPNPGFASDMATQAELDAVSATVTARQSLRTDELLHIRNEQTSGTDGGTFTSGAWRTRVLNTTKTNTITGASLATNQITLPAGTYWIDAQAPARTVNNHTAKLANITDTADTIIGTVEESSSTIGQTSKSIVQGVFTIAAQKVFELQHRCETTRATDGFGQAAGFSVVEVYAEVLIWKVA